MFKRSIISIHLCGNQSKVKFCSQINVYLTDLDLVMDKAIESIQHPL